MYYTHKIGLQNLQANEESEKGYSQKKDIEKKCQRKAQQKWNCVLIREKIGIVWTTHK